MIDHRNGYQYAALFYWRNARLFRNGRTELEKKYGEENLRVCAAMQHFKLIKLRAMRDLGQNDREELKNVGRP